MFIGYQYALIVAFGFSCWASFCSVAAAQDEPADRPLVESSFAQVLQADRVSAESGASPRDRARSFATWMKTQSWRSLSPSSQLELLNGLSADEIDRRRFSVRWVGMITAPVDGTYRFHQMRQIYKNSVMRVWVGGEQVLDSSVPDSSSENGPTIESKPVALTAQEVLPFRVDFFHDVDFPITGSEGAPLAVLAWSRDGGEPQLIPKSALRVDGGIASKQGLSADYFSGTTWDPANKKGTRTDDSVAFAWSVAPVIPVFQQEFNDVRDQLWRGFLSGQAFAKENEINLMVETVIPGLAKRLPVSQRRELVQMILDRPEVQRSTSAAAMAELIEATYMLPGKEHIELLAAWSLVNPHPQTAVGQYPGEGTGFFETLNTKPYQRIGRFLQGPNWQNVVALWDRQLRRSDGECNIRLVCATAQTSFFESEGRQLLGRLRDGAADETLSGDQRMTWLVAHARALSLMGTGIPRPMRGLPLLEEAMLVGTSNQKRFFVLQEMASIYASLDGAEELDRLLNQYEQEFTLPDQVAAIQVWREKAKSLEAVYAELRNRPNLQPIQDYIAELERRLAAAQGRADENEVQRYQSLLTTARNELSKLESPAN